VLERKQHLQSQLRNPKQRKKEKNDEFVKGIVKKFHLLQESESARYKDLLIRAGQRDKNAIYRLAFWKGVLPFVGLVLGAMMAGLGFNNFTEASWEYIVVFGSGYVGIKIPDVLLHNMVGKRMHSIRKGLPDGLDLMMVCAEAGLTISTAFERVARELATPYPELSEELSLTSVEMSFLPDKRTALDNFQKRNDIPEVRGIVSVLAQTEKYGTPVAQALRALAGEYRTQRMLRAEQKAARLPAIMTVPMICFILPSLFIIVIAPAAIQVADTWK
jgi:tight adherence protein C